MSDLCDLGTVIIKLETLDATLRRSRRNDRKEIVIGSLAVTILELAKRIDAVLEILHGAADGLAAMGDTGGLEGTSELELGDEAMQ